MKKKGSTFTKQNVEIKAIIADKTVNKLLFFVVIIAPVTMMMTLEFSCADRCDRERDCGFHIVTVFELCVRKCSGNVNNTRLSVTLQIKKFRK